MQSHNVSSAPGGGREAEGMAWAAALPAAWRKAVVAPLSFEVFREYEVNAWRCVGRDEDGEPCYCAHAYLLNNLCSDDGEDFYEELAYGEALSAWRLRDGRWLAFRTVAGGGGEVQRFHSLSESMPR